MPAEHVAHPLAQGLQPLLHDAVVTLRAPMQVWSAAASTGEEAYSAAMLFEEFREQHPAFRYRILGTDIANRVLDVGRAGQYLGRTIEGLRKLRPAMLEKYFRQQDETSTVLPALRAGVSFRPHNLYQPLSDPTRFDLVLLRNVLIYFDQPTRHDILRRIHPHVAADGYLLGTPANLGYVSGALKHAFDCAYYQLLDSTRGRPFGLYLHGNEGTEGAERAVDTITTGLGWSKAAATVIVSGKPSKDELQACWELGATVAAQLMD